MPVPNDTAQAFADIWERELAALAAQRDLADPEDRALFRMSVADATRHATRDAILQLARQLGARPGGNISRAAASRMVADAWIARAGEARPPLKARL